MSERQRLVEKFKEAAMRGQHDVADAYFQAALEAGAKELDAPISGSGDVWRGLGRAVANIRPLAQET